MKLNLIKSFIFTILFTLCSKDVQSQQTLNGKFCRDYKHKDFYKCITFKDGNQFEFISGGDLTFYKRSGTYQLDNNRLLLFYNPNERDRNSVVFTSTSQSQTDTVKVAIRILDINKAPVLGVEIELGGHKSDTNEKGEAQFYLKKSDQLLLARTFYLGYQTCNFLVNLEKDNFIEVEMQRQTNDKEKRNKIDTLIIKSILSKSFVEINKLNQSILWNKEKR